MSFESGSQRIYRDYWRRRGASSARLAGPRGPPFRRAVEGHDTHPIDIERALKGDYSQDAKKRDLQLEAKAHIAVQHWIDTGGLKSPATTTDSITAIHRRFCEQPPEDLLWVEDPAAKEKIKVVPDALRHRDVQVGRHVPVSAPAVSRFLKRYEDVYSKLGKTETIIATAAAHHRLAWIHITRSSTAMGVSRASSRTQPFWTALDTGAVWSIARGLARNVNEYKGHLAPATCRAATISTGAATSARRTLPNSRNSS